MSFSVDPVFAGENSIVDNAFFSIIVPDSWTYTESSDTAESRSTGYGLLNTIHLTPVEFSDLLLQTDVDKFREKLREGGAYATFYQDIDYGLKNAPLESYVKYVIDLLTIQNISSQQYTTVGNEKAVVLHATDDPYYSTEKIVLYLTIHDNQPYSIVFKGDPKNYDKYLSEFEEMFRSFRFVDTPSEVVSENENGMNMTTNFSGANLTELNTSGTSDSNYPEELYDECVRVAGKPYCDFLFRK